MRRESLVVGVGEKAQPWGDVRVSPPAGDPRDGFRGGSDRPERESFSSSHLGLWIFLGTVTMLFAGFTSAYVVRQSGSDWQPLPRPPILWINTGVLMLSSLLLEIGRRRHRRRWMGGAMLLGLLFLCGQIVAWHSLRARGIYLPTHPHSSFFYILTGVHGAHVMGGLIAMLILLLWAWRDPSEGRRTRRAALCATYWHFVGALWLYLMVLLF